MDNNEGRSIEMDREWVGVGGCVAVWLQCYYQIIAFHLSLVKAEMEMISGANCLCHVNVLCVGGLLLLTMNDRKIIYGQITNYSYYFNSHPTHTQQGHPSQSIASDASMGVEWMAAQEIIPINLWLDLCAPQGLHSEFALGRRCLNSIPYQWTPVSFVQWSTQSG